MKITKRQLRRVIKEEIDPRLKSTHHDPRYQEGPPGGQEAYVASKETEAAEQERERKHDQKTLDFINPTQQHIQKYLDMAQKLNLKVIENTPRLLLVQGLEDDLVEFDAYFNEVEDPQVANSFYKTASKKDIRQNVTLAMKPVTEIAERKLRRESKMKITKRQLRRIIKEEKAKVLAEQKVRRIVRTALLAEGVDGTITTEEDLMNTITGQEVRLEIMGGGQEVRVLGDGRGRAAAAYDIDGVMQDMLSAAGGDGNAVLKKLQSVAKRVSTDGRTDRNLNITPDDGPPDYSEHGVH